MTDLSSYIMSREIQAIRVGRRLSRIRRAAKYTQRQLGEMISTTHQTIARYESGETAIPALVLQRIAVALNVSLDEFFNEE